MMKTPINGRTLRQHLTYSWWKYALLIILGAFSVNLYYTVSAYRSPPEKKVEFYIYGVGNEQALNAYMDNVHASEMPDMEEVTAILMTTDGTYGPMQLTTYVAAGEGDLYLLPRDQFVSMASQGAWIPLEDNEELMAIFNEAGVSLQSGWRRDSSEGTTRLFGIPASALPGLSKYAYAENGYLCVLLTGGNDENTLKFLKILCRDMIRAEE